MKTTINIPDDLFRLVKNRAAQQGTTFKEIVIEGLELLISRRTDQQTPFRLRDASVTGQGLQSPAAQESWDVFRDMIYQGRGT
jgi:hypothetical protein